MHAYVEGVGRLTGQLRWAGGNVHAHPHPHKRATHEDGCVQIGPPRAPSQVGGSTAEREREHYTSATELEPADLGRVNARQVRVQQGRQLVYFGTSTRVLGSQPTSYYAFAAATIRTKQKNYKQIGSRPYAQPDKGMAMSVPD